MRLLFTVLLFVVAGCGGGSERVVYLDQEGNEIENPAFPDTVIATEDVCSDPLLTRTAPLPRGSHPSWFINGINAVPPESDGFSIRLRSDGTMYGNFGRNTDISNFVLVHNTCGVGTRPPAYAGHWVYTSDDCFCQRYDILPSAVICISFRNLDSQTACSHHQIIPSASAQANASLQSSGESIPDWYDTDMEGSIERLPEIPEQVSDILRELE